MALADHVPQLREWLRSPGYGGPKQMRLTLTQDEVAELVDLATPVRIGLEREGWDIPPDTA